MKIFTSQSVFVLLTALLAFTPITSLAAASTLNVTMQSHIELNLPEQDVFIERSDLAAGQVVRVEGEEAKTEENLAKTVYASSGAVEHDPFKVGANPLGPFAKGASLGFTLRDWLAASGSGTYTVDGDSATLNLSFAKLVPSGVYTLWCSRVTFPPNVNIVDTPCGAADGSQNSFKADASGNGTFTLTMPALLESTSATASVIALAYHSDGKTYGANPGDFGKTTHVELAYLLPAPESSPTASASPEVVALEEGAETATTAQPLSTTWLIVIGAGIFIVGWWLGKRTAKGQ
ncbi:MAG: hypothetical protein HY459_01295 [Parcubacteria group bacterium]|nr:hypothetical protein [Parcubacteria group bacterium]